LDTVKATDPWTRWRPIDHPHPYRGTSHTVAEVGDTTPRRRIGFRFPEADRRDELKEIQEVYR
jgi:hypothetical protein